MNKLYTKPLAIYLHSVPEEKKNVQKGILQTKGTTFQIHWKTISTLNTGVPCHCQSFSTLINTWLHIPAYIVICWDPPVSSSEFRPCKLIIPAPTNGSKVA